KDSNGPPRSVRLFSVDRDHNRGTPVTFDHSRRGDSDHSPMPAVAVDHQTKRISQGRIFRKSLLDCIHNSTLFFLALAVQLVETLGDLARAFWIFHYEELDDIRSDVHAARRIDSRRNAKCNLLGTQWLAAQLSDFK